MPPAEPGDGSTPQRGLAAERTSLAWTRTALSLALIGGLLIRIGTKSAPATLAYPVGGLAPLGAAAAGLWLPTTRSRAAGRGDLAAQRAVLRSLSAGTAALAVASGVIVAVSAVGG